MALPKALAAMADELEQTEIVAPEQTQQPAQPTPAPATLNVEVPDGVATNDLQAALLGTHDAGALDALLYGAPQPAAAPAPAAPAANPAPAQPAATPETPAQAVPSTPAAATPEATPAAPEPTDTEPNGTPRVLPSRISTAQFDPVEQQAIALRYELQQRGEKIDLGEAYRRVSGLYQPTQAETAAPTQTATTTPAVPAPAPVAPAPDAISTLRTEVEALEQQIIEDGENQNLSSAEIAKAKVEHARKVAQLAALEAQAQTAAQAQQQAIVSQRTQVMNEVIAEYPDSNDDTTYLGSRIAAVVADIERTPNHPLTHLLQGHDAPRKVVNHVVNEIAPRIAQQRGISLQDALNSLKATPAAPATPAATPAQPQATAPRPVPRTLGVPPGSNAAPAQAPQLTAQDILNATTADPSLIEKILDFA